MSVPSRAGVAAIWERRCKDGAGGKPQEANRRQAHVVHQMFNHQGEGQWLWGRGLLAGKWERKPHRSKYSAAAVRRHQDTHWYLILDVTRTGSFHILLKNARPEGVEPTSRLNINSWKKTGTLESESNWIFIAKHHKKKHFFFYYVFMIIISRKVHVHLNLFKEMWVHLFATTSCVSFFPLVFSQ